MSFPPRALNGFRSASIAFSALPVFSSASFRSVVNVIQRRNRRIFPSVIKNELPTSCLEWLQVSIDRIQCAPGFLVRQFQICSECYSAQESPDLPIRDKE